MKWMMLVMCIAFVNLGSPVEATAQNSPNNTIIKPWKSPADSAKMVVEAVRDFKAKQRNYYRSIKWLLLATAAVAGLLIWWRNRRKRR
jgi:hypothetical protein